MNIKLLYFCSDYKIGLTQSQTEQIEYLSQEKSLDLICVSSEGEQEKGLHERLKNTGTEIRVIPKLDVHSDFKRLAKELGNIIAENSITHVNVQNNWQLALVSYIKYNPFNNLKFKIIYTIHGYRHNHPLKSLLAIGILGSALLLFADRVISMSAYVSRRFWFLSYKMDNVYYMMTKPEYYKDTNVIDTSRLSMVFPAQFRKGKRQEILVQAVRKYINTTNDASIRLYLPGAGPLLGSIKDLVQKLNLNENVIFPGKLSLSEVLEMYEKNNIALCSSNVETYGRCIAEPFMLGRCVITQKTGVAEDIIRHGENGFFFNTVQDLCEILVKLHRNPDLIVSTAHAAFRDRVVFMPKNVLASYLHSVHKA